MPKNLSQFWQELKRRNVIRVITVYAGAAFVIIELINNITEPLRLPDWTPTLVIVLLAIGFPIVFIFSWIYDVHPEEGIVKTKPTDKVKTADKPKSSNGWKIASYVSFVVIVGLIVLNVIPRTSNRKILDKSIAVLPFRNDSPNEEKMYFINGTMDAILDNLCMISDLRVVSRNTVEQYRDNAKPTPVVAEELNVSYVLEGSGQKLGNRVLLIVQLIDGKSDRHLWSKQYDREIQKVEDLIDIQKEISQLVAGEIQSIITPEEKNLMKKIPTKNLDAYDYYLRARQIYFNSSDDKQEREHVIQILDQAIALDPDFAKAYALKGRVLTYLRGFGVPMDIWRDSALALANKAIEIDPEVAEGYWLRGLIKKDGFGMLDEYRKDLEEAYRLAPGDVDVMFSLGELYSNYEGKYREGASLMLKSVIGRYNNKEPDYYVWWGHVFRWVGEYKKAEMLFEQAIRLDPGNVNAFYGLGLLYFFEMEEYQKAVDIYLEGLKIDPMEITLIDALAWCYLKLGDLDRAEDYYLKIPSIEAEFTDTTQYFPFRHRLGYVKWLKGEKEEAMRLFQEQMKLINETRKGLRGYGNFDVYKSYYLELGTVNAFLGNREEAYLWLDSALNFGFFDLYFPEHDPMFDGIRQEARFQDIMSIQREIELEWRNTCREVLYQPEFLNHIEWFFKEE